MEALIVWLFSSFGVYRLSRMIALEEGPLRLFDILRGLVESGFGAGSWVTRGINCPLCVSLWLALAMTIGLRGDWFNWLATAGLAAWLYTQEREL